MMGFFSDLTALPYPFAKYAQVLVYDFPWGGMENISATTETEQKLHPAADEADFSSEDLISHELAHQSTGDLVSCRSWDHTWLSEGFADYFAALWAGHAHGPEAFAAALDTLPRGVSDRGRRRLPPPHRHPAYSDPIRMFDAHSYQKGALVLHMARYLLGEDAWQRGLREYVRRFAGQTVTTADLQSTLEEVLGGPPRPALRLLRLRRGHPSSRSAGTRGRDPPGPPQRRAAAAHHGGDRLLLLPGGDRPGRRRPGRLCGGCRSPPAAPGRLSGRLGRRDAAATVGSTPTAGC